MSGDITSFFSKNWQDDTKSQKSFDLELLMEQKNFRFESSSTNSDFNDNVSVEEVSAVPPGSEGEGKYPMNEEKFQEDKPKTTTTVCELPAVNKYSLTYHAAKWTCQEIFPGEQKMKEEMSKPEEPMSYPVDELWMAVILMKYVDFDQINVQLARKEALVKGILKEIKKEVPEEINKEATRVIQKEQAQEKKKETPGDPEDIKRKVNGKIKRKIAQDVKKEAAEKIKKEAAGEIKYEISKRFVMECLAHILDPDVKFFER